VCYFGREEVDRRVVSEHVVSDVNLAGVV